MPHFFQTVLAGFPYNPQISVQTLPAHLSNLLHSHLLHHLSAVCESRLKVLSANLLSVLSQKKTAFLQHKSYFPPLEFNRKAGNRIFHLYILITPCLCIFHMLLFDSFQICLHLMIYIQRW